MSPKDECIFFTSSTTSLPKGKEATLTIFLSSLVEIDNVQDVDGPILNFPPPMPAIEVFLVQVTATNGARSIRGGIREEGLDSSRKAQDFLYLVKISDESN